ncbi:hypothetical protein [Caulobacter vibrioides]|uniref:Uncharacterized protein n=1 Tax=Caulobacter phage S2B TaxID=2759120 RepID=A0AAE7ML90_9CAUD|nr:hypothetical protein [Caulobacter vibrioides]QOC54167.1 hypothetical protein [Caulobacter phage S2B]QXZ53881.1 hypothetical protein KZH45_09510 [Caulobacter vibrioides]
MLKFKLPDASDDRVTITTSVDGDGDVAISASKGGKTVRLAYIDSCGEFRAFSVSAHVETLRSWGFQVREGRVAGLAG